MRGSGDTLLVDPGQYYRLTSLDRTLTADALDVNRDPDPGYWATGNAWAAAGMLRVYATIDNSDFSGGMKNQKKDLKNWVQEIHKGVYERYFVRSRSLLTSAFVEHVLTGTSIIGR